MTTNEFCALEPGHLVRYGTWTCMMCTPGIERGWGFNAMILFDERGYYNPGVHLEFSMRHSQDMELIE